MGKFHKKFPGDSQATNIQEMGIHLHQQCYYMMSTSADLELLRSLKFFQINLNLCKNANENAKQCMIDKSIDMALLQNAHCGKGGKLTNFHKTWPALSSSNSKAHAVGQKVALVYSHSYSGTNCAFFTVMDMALRMRTLIPISSSPWTNSNN